MTDTLNLMYPAVRGLILLTIVLLIGTVLAHRIAERRMDDADLAARAHVDSWMSRLPGLLAWFLLTLSLGRGSLQLLSFAEPGQPIERELANAVLMEGTWGHSWILQTAIAVVLLAGTWLLRERRPIAYVTTTVCVGLLVWAQSGMGHAAGDLWPGPLGRIIGSLHLLGVGMWLGTLAVLCIAVLPILRSDGRALVLARVVRDFSVPARIGAGLLVVSGVVSAWRYVGSVHALVSTTYGFLLLGKLGVLGGVAAVGWWNWRVITPLLERSDPAAPRRLRRAATIELILGVVAIAVTALLVASPIPVEMLGE